MSDSCDHQAVYVNCSSAAANAGFVRPSPEQRTLAMSKTSRLARGVYLAKEDPMHDEQTFPGPLVLPGDHLAEHPKEQGQPCKDWFASEPTQKRFQEISTRKKMYVFGPPSVKRLPEEMRSWASPVLPPGFPPCPDRWTWTLKQYKQLIIYLRAFFTTMPISQFAHTAHFELIKGRRRVHFEDTPQTSVIGFRGKDGRDTFEVRHRPSPDGLSKMQLNVSDLRTALAEIKAEPAHSVVMVLNHDLYEEEEGSYITERVWVEDGVAIVSTFRRNPCFDRMTGIDRLHRWPASHCQSYVDTRNHLSFKAFGKPPGDSALGLAIKAANQAGQPSSMEDLSYLWFARVLVAVSREAARCFGLRNCTYYACLMQGVSGMRQAGETPPYLCPVCYSKLGSELVLLKPVYKPGIEREEAWLGEHYAELKAFCNKWDKIPHFAAFEAWLGKRLEDRKGDDGDGGDTAGPSN
ncbi:uncharacterized protein FFB20_15144 [Fusarium fujikuroi]|uniref:Archaemetzincin-2 n=1 Tax=Gibberella fujikuroi (strain CBS 195.34 / IMI 58289 / NRRL A-6831) TaxID=1279085 RepID=S0DT25_GIBF5|nr:uncharacterized protein FFUJ_05094 [Fusarium fujikuroi IMI 58289]KLP03615.1 uncharacterized protein Y057_2771 [Fusarium fujikuroi]QGI77225.1 hypothetical protein CEK25_003954 [Fusarium fujikuroi]CCT63748.1 uncharacterized protein FFUJ_05094 [Fusarium fujikuroi IMI 58289]SCN98623.1 uncharacterized protein FFM5_06908 [Fusarium fujikuroi]SCO17099.1 uncharacterized protein FFB20_15144 [Fusarium fujikuroi]